MLQKSKMISSEIDQFSISFKVKEKIIKSMKSLQDYVFIAESAVKYVESCLGGFRSIFNQDISSTNLPGYDTTYTYDSIVKIAYHSAKPEQGLILYFTGRGWHHYKDVINIPIYKILQRFSQIPMFESYKIVRLDYAVDFYNDDKADVGKLFKSIKRGSTAYYNGNNVANASQLVYYGSAENVETVYFGSRSNEFCLRCYNKRKQQLEAERPEFLEFAKVCDSWVRYEAEMKKELAHSLTAKIEKCTNEDEVRELLASIVMARLKFKSVKKGSLHYVSQKINEIANGKVFDTVVRKCIHNQDIQKSKDWYFSDSAGLMGLLYKIEKMSGKKAVKDYLTDIFNYYDTEYQPTKSVLDWVRKNTK